MYDVVIIGGGPAGMSCGLYAGRAGMKTMIVEKMFSGGQMSTTNEVENYPGVENVISGAELAYKFENQARKFGVEFLNADVTGVQLEGAVKKIVTSQETLETKTVVFAMGTVARKLGLEDEARLTGKGVSYCATCDGAFFRGKDVAVIGGGDTALEDAIFLSRFCSKVYLVHRRNEFRGAKVLQDQVLQTENIEICYQMVAEKILGENRVEGVVLRQAENMAQRQLTVQGIFVAVGSDPSSQLVQEVLELSKGGYILTDDTMQTSIPGVYAAGDIREKQLRQIITAASDGAIAGFNAALYATKFVPFG
ncbi:MAG: thioredoxin-disulfide reductase [Clostridia bacterium]|nr:thioredoxin-disulfide reductase [Clostridia bacterium]